MSNEAEEVPFEFSILGLAMSQPQAICRLDKELDPADVGLVHGMVGIYEVYKSMLSYYHTTKLDIVDPIAFKTWMQTESKIYESLGGIDGVNRLIDKIMEVELPSLDSAIQIIKHRAVNRRRLDKAQELLVAINDKSDKSSDDQDRIRALTDQIQHLYQDLQYDPLASVTTAKDIIDNLDDIWNIPPFLPTQFKSLNQAMGYDQDLGGFFRGGVHAVVALSGKGKSTFTKNLCNHWLDNGYSVLFINFEEPRAHWERILMTQVTLTNVYSSSKTISDGRKRFVNDQFIRKLEEWGDRLMVRHDPDSLFFEDLEKWLRDLIGNDRKPDVVVIDTIQSLFTKTGGKARWGEFEQIMVRLEKLAKDMDSVFIITSQQNNNSLREKREELNQSDVGGGVTIVQKATVILILTPLNQDDDLSSLDEGLMQIQMPKNRITGTEYLKKPPVIKYVDNIKSYVPFDPHIEDVRYKTDTVEVAVLEGGIY